MRPAATPLGLHLTRAHRIISRAFDDALAAAGGSLPAWLVLLNLRTRQAGNQRELAAAVGIREATLTHHLNAMETGGLITRRRDPANRRIHLVELTPAGEHMFTALARAATAFDARLRAGLTDQQVTAIGRALDRLVANVAGPAPAEPPRTGIRQEET